MPVAEILRPPAFVILAVLVMLFGASPLPKLSRSIGSAQAEFRKGLQEAHGSETNPPAADRPTPAA